MAQDEPEGVSASSSVALIKWNDWLVKEGICARSKRQSVAEGGEGKVGTM